MPESENVRAKEMANHAEHVHDQAAVSKGKQDHLSGAELLRDSQEKQREAHERAEALIRESEKKQG